MTSEAFVADVLDQYARADLFDELVWRVEAGRVRFFAMCSDTFHWASADLEEILPGDLALLRQCQEDLTRHGEPYMLSSFFSARKRGMRPMRMWFDVIEMEPPVRQMFLDAGPERDPATEG